MTKSIQIGLRLHEDRANLIILAAAAEGTNVQSWIRSAIEKKLETLNICQNCQNINRQHAKFCEECGSPLNPEVTQ